MTDTDALNIIKINIHTIGAEQTGGSGICCTNMHTVWRDDLRQEAVRAENCYENTDSISKSNSKTMPMVESKFSKTIEYFLSGLRHDSSRKRSTEITEQLHIEFEDLFNGIGCFDGTFSL